MLRNLNNLCYSHINLLFHAQHCIRVCFTHILVLTIDNLTRMRMYVCEVLNFNFRMDNATESLLWFYWPLDCFALRDAYDTIHQILIWTDYVRCLDSLYTLDSNPVSAQQLANNFPSSLYWSFSLLCRRFFSVILPICLFCFLFLCFWGNIRNDCLCRYPEVVLWCFLLDI